MKTITETDILIHSEEFLNRSRLKETFFTRKRKMDFPAVIMFLVNLLKLSLKVELIKFNRLFLHHAVCISKSAFSKARRKISFLAFRELFELTSKIWLQSQDFHLYKGHRIFAVDGSIVQLPDDSMELFIDFGTIGKTQTAVRARASILCDVLDHVVVHAEIDGIHTDERSLALRHITFFDEFATSKDIIIFDRGYPSHELIAELEAKRWKYLFRIPRGFNFQIDLSLESDFTQIFRCRKRKRHVRVLKFPLLSGEIEQLITNISPKFFQLEDFISLYALRWPVETKYDTIKNKLCLETFSGKTTVSVKQDFYSTMYIANLVAFAKLESNEIIAMENEGKVLKYQYIANENVLIGIFKNEIITALLCRSQKKRKQLLQHLIEEIARNRSEIRPDRHFSRPENLARWGSGGKNKPKTAI
jgi:hypothetical protein